MNSNLERDCPACGTTFGSVIARGVCPNCGHKCDATPTHLALAGRLGKCDASGLRAAIAAYHDVPCLQSLDLPICQSTANRIPELVAREYRIIPVVVSGAVRIAIHDPMIPELAELLTRLTGVSPKFAVASPDLIRRRINDFYGVTSMASAVAWTE